MLGFIRSPREFAGGVALLALSLAVSIAIRHLDVGQLRRMGPGFLPLVMCALIGIGGAFQIVRSLLFGGPPLERWNVKALALILGGILLFAVTLQPLGLGLATFMLAFISALASPTRRIREVVLLSMALSAFALLLFPIALGVVVPLWPFR